MKTSIHFCFASGIALCCLAMTASTQAQIPIKPDETLPTNSEVELQGNTSVITGGTVAGSSNLFHSFEQFCVLTGSAAHFNNTSEIQNIITRVTGGSISNIDGLLRTNGTANLFLLNPNGIVFGPNARLDVRGSFVASTADRVVFDNGFAFSATNPQASRLLTVNVPLGLQFGANPGRIVNQSVEGLDVRPGRTLALVGGDVSLDGGILQAPGGRVELGGVAGAETVGLNVDGNTLRLSFPDGVTGADVSLANGAEVNVAAGSGGSIAINARNIDVSQGSGLRAGIRPLSGSDSAIAGDITLNATGITKIENGFIYNAAIDIGNAGNIGIDTGQLIVRDGVVATVTVSEGNAGDISVNASESVQLTASPSSNGRVSFDIPIRFSEPIRITVPIGLFAASFDVGNSAATDIPDYLTPFIPQPRGDVGNLTINTGQLIVRDGAWVATTGGEMPAGELTVNARESVELSGTSANGRPSFLSSGTRGAGDAKPLTINTQRLIVSNGGIISAGTAGSGRGADLTINASESVELIGTSRQGLSAAVLQQMLGDSGVFVFDIVEDRPFPSGIVTGTVGGRGNAGSLAINTGRLLIQGGAQASVSTLGAGDAGSLIVHASSVELTGTSPQPNPNDIVGRSLLTAAVGADSTGNGGNITVKANSLTITDGAALTASISGQGNVGGNIDLQVRDLILMRRNSLISAEADNNGNGGNIDIDAPFIVAVPNENSDIIADAVRGRGGNINITAQGIYGLEYREPTPLTSDIDASSQFGVNGTVQINTPDVDPSRGVANLPEAPVPEEEIAQGCLADKENSFTVTGRGGLPQQPGEALRTEAVRVNGDTLETGVENRSTEVTSTPLNSPTPAPLVEAQGWVVNAQGQVVLTASAPTVTPNSSWLNSISCHALQKSS